MLLHKTILSVLFLGNSVSVCWANNELAATRMVNGQSQPIGMHHQSRIIQGATQDDRKRLPLTWGKQGVYQNYTRLEDHPGRWECSFREGPSVVRDWRWTVRPNVIVAPHPEEGATLTFFPGAHLIETEIPAGGSFIDRRIFPAAVQAGFIYGHRWQTPEGKAMAARVPAKGKPWPVPSTAR